MPSMGTDFSPIDRANEEKKGLYPAEPQVRALLREAAVGGGRRAEPCGIIPFIFFLAALLVFCSGTLFCLDSVVSKREISLDINGESNRAAGFTETVTLGAAVELGGRYTVSGGVGFAAGGYGAGLNAAAAFRARPWQLPFDVTLAYLFNAAPRYETASHTVLPALGFNGTWAGITAGVSFRFTSFFGEEAIFEPVISFAAYVNVVNTQTLRIGIECRNFNESRAGNMGAYSLGVKSLVRVNEHWSLSNGIEILHSGSVALSANFYGIAFGGGIRATW